MLPKFENIMCNTQQEIAFWIQAVGFLQLPCDSLRLASKHSCRKARQKGVKSLGQGILLYRQAQLNGTHCLVKSDAPSLLLHLKQLSKPLFRSAYF